MIINNIKWTIRKAKSGSPPLTRSDGTITIGMTDGRTHTVYIDERLKGRLLEKVIAHELVHCFVFSYGIRLNARQEEFMADWVATYGRDLINLLDEIMHIKKPAEGDTICGLSVRGKRTII